MRMSILLFDGFTALDAIGGYEVLANVPGVEVEFVAVEKGAIAADTRRLGFVAYRRIDEVTDSDILYVPGGPGVVRALEDAHLLEWIARTDRTTTWTLGICNGVALLAAAGVLTGTTVTTNWGWRDRVAGYGVDVVNERFHRDGRIVTGAGVSASIDTALFLAALIADEDVARLVQLGIEYFPSLPSFARRSIDEVPQNEKDLVSAFEAGAAAERLAHAPIPFEAVS